MAGKRRQIHVRDEGSEGRQQPQQNQQECFQLLLFMKFLKIPFLSAQRFTSDFGSAEGRPFGDSLVHFGMPGAAVRSFAGDKKIAEAFVFGLRRRSEVFLFGTAPICRFRGSGILLPAPPVCQDVAPVDHGVAAHRGAQPRPVGHAELLPFGDEDNGIGPFGGLVHRCGRSGRAFRQASGGFRPSLRGRRPQPLRRLRADAR